VVQSAKQRIVLVKVASPERRVLVAGEDGVVWVFLVVPAVNENKEQTRIRLVKLAVSHLVNNQAGRPDEAGQRGRLLERGEVGSNEEHLTVTQFKVEQKQQRLARIQDAAAYAVEETQRRNEEMEEARKRAQRAQAQLDAVVPKVEAVEELARRYFDDVDKVLPEAGALETARSYREKKAKPLYKKIVDVLRALHNKYLDLINSFNRLNDSYNRLQQRYSSLDASFDRLAEENRGQKQVAADYDALCRGYGADRVEEQVRAIREREEEQKRQRRMLRQKMYVNMK